MIGLACAAAMGAAWPDRAAAQVATIGKGHQYFLNSGLQIWGLDQGSPNFNYNGLAGANFTGVMWSYGQDYKAAQLTTGQKWGKWVDATGSPATALDATQQSKINDLLSLQVGDEQQSDLENPNGHTAAWFNAAHSGNYFPNQLLYTNSFFINSDANYANFIAAANPDAISFDSYPFDEPYGSVILPNNWLSLAGRFRRHALSSYATYNGNPIGSNAPRPYGMYVQSYAAQESASAATRHPGDVEMRWQQFTAWTMGYSWVDAFHVGSSSGSLFLNGDMTTPLQPRYDQFKETARQGRNLGPALTRLISYGYGPSIVVGKDAAGNNNPVPSDWLPFQTSDAPANQRYLTSLSAQNIGTKNNGQPGDLYVGFFNPLHTSFGPAGETYFMVTNALGAYLDDETATVAQTTQQVTLNFDTQYSGVSTLQRLRRSDGQLEIVPLTRTSARLYQLQFNLEGGTGDLFKYNDGTPFVGVNNSLYWDNDANAGNNNAGTGAGLGGAGTWDAAANKWFNGSANAAWAGNRDAIFTGAGAAVTLATPQAVNSLQFKTNGYTLSGAAVTMAGQFIHTDSGVTATITSDLAGTGGIAKSGPGTLIIGNANSYSGGTAVTGGVLQIGSDASLGVAPASFTAANIVLNGGTLRFAADLNLNNNRGIDIGAGGGTIDTQGFTNAAGYNASNGGFRGPGDLTKIGSGTFFAAATTGGANTTWKGRLIVKEGTWKIVASDGLPYNVPLADGLKADQILLDGGTWQIGATISVTNARRGVTVGLGGGSIDTQGFNLSWAGPIAGVAGPTAQALTKLGSGTLTFTGVGAASTYNGNVNVAAGTLALANGIGMGDLAAITLANVSGATLNITGNETIGSLAGGGTTGGNVTLGSNVTLTLGANSSSTTYAGAITGSGGITKVGGGTMALTGSSSYSGATMISAGTLTAGTSANLGHLGNTLVLNGGTLKSRNSFSMQRALVVNAGSSSIDAADGNVVFFAQGDTTFNSNLNVTGGQVYISRTGGVSTVAPGATVTVSLGALFGLGGSGGALSDGVDHVNIVNDLGSSFYAFPGGASANHVVGTVIGNGSTTVDANATLTATHIRQSALTTGGTVIIRPGAGPVSTSDIDSLTFLGAGKLDLKDNKLVTKTVVGSASGGVYTGVQGMVQSARNGGSWNGSGITTSMPAAMSGLTSLGVATAAATGDAGGTFSGISVDTSDVLVMYTYAGDANLDGFISGDDYAAIDFNIATPGADGWVNGDFNWDGIISGDDYTVIDFNVVAQSTPFSTAGGVGGSVVAVPEPVAGLFIALAGPAMLLRRRRRVF